jgi:DNA-binding SARP family transcriptional activator/tetratricopeptide (TPR) repeat protein
MRPVGSETAVGLLGPIRVWSDDGWLRPGTPQQCLVLSFLALRAGQVVPAGELVDAVWDSDPPRSAHNGIQVILTHLRKALARTPGAQLARCGAGYQLDADPTRIDVHQFRSLVRAGRDAGDAGSAVTLLGQALALWRGPALADAADTVKAAQLRDSLAQERLAVAEDRAGALLRCGREQEAAAELPDLVAEHPLREGLAGLLMLALYRTGCQGDALAVYQQVRGTLVTELGIEPGDELQHLHRRILASDPGLLPVAITSAPAGPQEHDSGAECRDKSGAGHVAALRPQEPATTFRHGSQRRAPARPHQPPAVVPRQLPAVAPHFTGREAKLAELDAVLGATAGDGAAVVISAVGGMAGVGKTALAVRWAHRVADRFPDGQLYVNLQGFGPAGDLVDPAAAIRGFLDGLGVAAERIPVTAQAQAGLYRSLLAGRRMLLVLDNARDEDQVRPLLPGSGSCVVVVTSRTRLTGLAAGEGARLVSLDVLSDDDAHEVLAGRLGDGRAAAEPDALAGLIGLCGRLPLALAITAARAADRPGFPLAGLAAELREGQRLAGLDAGDAATSVRTVFWWSYQQLDAAAARMFRLLGLHPGPDITEDAAARLAGLPGEQARDLLRGLVRGCLLTEPRPGRYVFHDLLRAYAAGQAEAADSHTDRHAALTRLFDYYLAAAEAATEALPVRDWPQAAVAPDQGVRDFTSNDAARAWLDAERANLTAIAAHAAVSGWPGCTIRLATALFGYLDDAGHYTDARTVHTAALGATRRVSDRAAQADELRHCAADFRQGRYDQARAKLRQALEIYRDLGDLLGQERTLCNLGLVLRRQGSYAESADHHRQALALARAIGDTFGQALALTGLGSTLCLQGRYQPAIDHHRQAIALYREIGNTRDEGFALENLAVALVRKERWQEAADCVDLALAALRQAGSRHSEAAITNTSGAILAGQGRYQEAADHCRQALTLYRELGDRSGEAGALNSIGEALTALGSPAQASSQHQDAFTVAAEVNDRYQQARAHCGLARVSTATGDAIQARRHWQHALALYTDLGCPEATQVRTALQDLEADTAER